MLIYTCSVTYMLINIIHCMFFFHRKTATCVYREYYRCDIQIIHVFKNILTQFFENIRVDVLFIVCCFFRRITATCVYREYYRCDIQIIHVFRIIMTQFFDNIRVDVLFIVCCFCFFAE